jgi:hypothetical protein
MTSNDFFLTSQCFNELHLTSRDVKKAAVLELLRLKKSGVLESCGEKRGCYRLVEKDVEELQWWTSDTSKTLDLHLPLDLHKVVKFYPKSVIVVAGTTDAGKTALLLNVALMNLHNFKINYFSSEMPNEKLKDRLENFLKLKLITNLDI